MYRLRVQCPNQSQTTLRCAQNGATIVPVNDTRTQCTTVVVYWTLVEIFFIYSLAWLPIILGKERIGCVKESVCLDPKLCGGAVHIVWVKVVLEPKWIVGKDYSKCCCAHETCVEAKSTFAMPYCHFRARLVHYSTMQEWVAGPSQYNQNIQPIQTTKSISDPNLTYPRP